MIEKSADDFWKVRVLDKYLEDHKGFACGGCFKNIFNGDKIKDVDVFFGSLEDFLAAVDHFERDDGYCLYYENANVTAFKEIESGVVVELCRKIFGSPEQILNQFDFTVTKFAYYNKEVEDDDGGHIEKYVLMHEDFFQHLYLKRLVIDDKVLYPMSTLERMFRYVRYGFSPCKNTKVRIAEGINGLTPEQIVASESLYAGVD